MGGGAPAAKQGCAVSSSLHPGFGLGTLRWDRQGPQTPKLLQGQIACGGGEEEPSCVAEQWMACSGVFASAKGLVHCCFVYPGTPENSD